MEREVEIPADGNALQGMLSVPTGAKGLVIFAHGSGSSRLSPRNVLVAKALQRAGFGTLLIDLLTVEEESSRENVFDISLLAERLHNVAVWARHAPETKKLPVGYFGASTGAAAALSACTMPGTDIFAVVSRGGRPDLAEELLTRVQAPTLLIVGGNDDEVIKLNEAAFKKISAQKSLVIIPGATHLFEEPGALEEVARLAADWFGRYAR